ncbi:mucin-19-like isoform X2 [Agrilus planipennis]|uniref:Mucin-19-like isoform X2 n=1 Tax=Agrilus planipennis TaxID=224129 RepID=A0A1W4XAV1_AGRPL|nr:mucin-19-like isoform X2 [Agrilus planipennis]
MARGSLIFKITVIFSFLVTKCYNLKHEKMVAIINPTHFKCYLIEKNRFSPTQLSHITSASQKLHKKKLFKKSKTKLTTDELKSLAGHKIFKSCKSYDSYLLQVVPKFVDHSFKQRTRYRRSNSNYFGRVRGQTQSQYLSFGNENTPGKAEAEATHGTSKAVVSGSNGIGSAQSQTNSGDCGDCLYGKDSSVQSLYYGRGPDRGTGGSPYGPTYTGAEIPQSQRQRPGTTDLQTVSGTFPSGSRPSAQDQTFGQPQAPYPTGHPSPGQQTGQSYPSQQIPYPSGYPTQGQIGVPHPNQQQIAGLPQGSVPPELPSRSQIPGMLQAPVPTGLSSQGQVPGQSQVPYQAKVPTGGQIAGQYPGQTQVALPESGSPQDQFSSQPQSQYQPGQSTGQYPSQASIPYQPGRTVTYEPSRIERPREGSSGQRLPSDNYPYSATGQRYDVPPQIPGQYTPLTQDIAQQYGPQRAHVPVQQQVSTTGDTGNGRGAWQGQSGQFGGQISGTYHPGQASGQFSGVFSGKYSHDQYGYSPPNVYGSTIGGYPGVHTYTPGNSGAQAGGQTEQGQIPSNIRVSGNSPSQQGPFSGQTGILYQQLGTPANQLSQISPTGQGNVPSGASGIPAGQGGYPTQQSGQTSVPSGQIGQTGTTAGQVGYPTGTQTGFLPAVSAGYPGSQTGYPTGSLPGYSTQQAVVPTGGQISYPQGGLSGFSTGGQSGYPSREQSSLPPGGQTGYPTGGQINYPTGAQTGYPTGETIGQVSYPTGATGQVSYPTGATGQVGYPTGGTNGQIGYPGQIIGSSGQIGYPSAGQTGQITGTGQGWQGSSYPQGTAGLPSHAGQQLTGGTGVSQFGQVPSELTAPQDKDEKDADSQAQAEVQHANETTEAKAQAQGFYAGGTAQSQVSGSYSGSGSFNALAGTIDGKRGAQTQVAGGKEGATSNAQGTGGAGLSQAQVQLASETGDTTSNAQSSGLYHGTNTQVQAGSKGGLADAQATGPGSTSSQAQIGFTPHNEEHDNDTQNTPFKGGGTASAQSGSYAGQTQSQLQGKFRFGVRYTGAAQAGSGSKDTVNSARNQTRPPGLSGLFSPFKPITYSSGNSPNDGKSQQQEGNTSKNKFTASTANEEKVMQRRISKVHKQYESSPTTSTTSATISETIATTLNPLLVYNTVKADDYNDEDYEDYDGEVQDTSHSGAVISQNGRTQRQNIILDPLEDLDANVIQSKGDPDLADGTVLQPGQDIPGSYGYRIPTGFRGRVTSVANNSNAFALGHNSQAQSVSLKPGTGKIVYRPPTYAIGFNTQLRNGGRLGIGSGYTYQPVSYQLKSADSPSKFVSVTKSESGSKDIRTGAKKPSIFYTQSSTCGFFTNTCVIKGNRKICIPKPKINPDGSLAIC